MPIPGRSQRLAAWRAGASMTCMLTAVDKVKNGKGHIVNERFATMCAQPPARRAGAREDGARHSGKPSEAPVRAPQGRGREPGKSDGVLGKGSDVKYAFIERHAPRSNAASRWPPTAITACPSLRTCRVGSSPSMNQRRSGWGAALVQPRPAALDAGQSTSESQCMSQLWDTDSRGKVRFAQLGLCNKTPLSVKHHTRSNAHAGASYFSPLPLPHRCAFRARRAGATARRRQTRGRRSCWRCGF